MLQKDEAVPAPLIKPAMLLMLKKTVTEERTHLPTWSSVTVRYIFYNIKQSNFWSDEFKFTTKNFESVVSLLAASFYQGNADRRHK